jgi:hypothetical protein
MDASNTATGEIVPEAAEKYECMDYLDADGEEEEEEEEALLAPSQAPPQVLPSQDSELQMATEGLEDITSIASF